MNRNEGLAAPDNMSPLERIRRTNASGAEYWPSRGLAQMTKKLKTACFNSGQHAEDHFVDITEMIPDHMGATELTANLFRPAQTEDKLRCDRVTGKQQANRTHFQVGTEVRKTIQELGGAMPENMPRADSIKKLDARKKRQPKALKQPPTDSRAEGNSNQERGV